MTAVQDATWSDWLQSWDRQQTGYLPDREERYDVMLSVVEEVCGPAPAVLDLACGPGSISARALERFPAATSVAIDWDPVLLTIGREALGDLEGRLAWVEADLRDGSWPDALPRTGFDAVLTTTALHWFTEPELRRLYAQVFALLRPGGVLLNGDNFHRGTEQPTLDRVSRQLQRQGQEGYRSANVDVEDWSAWWLRMESEGGGVLPLAERAARFAYHSERHDETSGYRPHHDAMVAAGFTEVDSVWCRGTNHVLAAVR